MRARSYDTSECSSSDDDRQLNPYVAPKNYGALPSPG